MPGTNIWTIHNTGNSTGNNLNGCHIVQTATGYDLTQPNVNNVMASSTTNPPSFSNVPWAGLYWWISLNSPLSPDVNDNGTWGCEQGPSPEGDPTEHGDFTAQAGSQVDADADAASSATA